MSKNPLAIVSNDADASSTPSNTAHENGDPPLTTSPTPLSQPRAYPQPTADSLDASTQHSSSPPTTSTVKVMPEKAHLNGSAPQKQPSVQSPTFFEKLLRFLIPCVSSSSAAHPVEVEEPVIAAPEPEKQVQKAAVEPEKSTSSQVTLPPHDPSRTDLPKPTIVTSHSRPVTPIGEDADVVLPPTPTTQLLPADETEGMTSGAVQPPGSKGDSPLHEKSPHHTPTHTNGDGDESETSYEEELDEQEDEEDRLILNGGAGIPMGPDGIPKPLLPPISPQHAGRKCLVLDLDETLVHSSFKSISQADYVVPVEIEYHWHNVYVIKRPGVDNFLKKMGEIYEVVVFTASLSKYADPVLDKLDIHQVVSHRLFRESCYNHKGNYVKDLSQLGRPIADTIILDNSPASYIFHPNNAVPVSSWFNDPHDTELTDLVPFLADLSTAEDVRGILDGAR